MSYIILSINAGSSSVKVSVYRASGSAHDPQELADAEVSGLSTSKAKLKYVRGGSKIADEELQDVQGQEAAFKHILQSLITDEGLPDLKNKDDIRYACHRIVHGGDYRKVQVINQETFHHLEELSALAPLHNGVGLSIVHVVNNELPKAVNMAYFDSAFHATMPAHVYSYAIDPAKAEKNKLRKYGFHGISYSFITRSVAARLGKNVKDLNIIALHLGSGASACAVKNGQSLDTSMGLTPLAGLPGGSRSGDVDPSLVFHYTHDAGKPAPSSTQSMHITQAEEILNKQSGFKALTGTADFGKIVSSDDSSSKLAVDLFVDRVIGFIGSYYVKLGGSVDALVFAGGIGEKSVEFRRRVVEAVECLGFSADPKKNSNPGDETVTDISLNESKDHRVLICQTDEQFEMARGCALEAESLSAA